MAVTVSVPIKPDNVPTVTAPLAVVPSYTFDAIVGLPMVNALAVIFLAVKLGWVKL